MAPTLPENILRHMPASERKKLGQQTAEEAQAKFAARNERELQNQIAGLLRIRGIWHYCARMDRKTTAAKGCPDFLFAVNGAATALEVKFQKGKLSPEQERAHEVMRRNGWRVEVVRSLDGVKAILDQRSE